MAFAEGSPVFISVDAIEKVFDWADTIAGLKAAYASDIQPANVPSRTIASGERSHLRTLPANPPGCRYYGAKIMGVTNVAGRPQAEYVIVLFNRDTGHLAAFVDGYSITAYRTAATSAVGLDTLAPAGPIRLGVLGSGLEAAMHVRAFAAVRPLEQVVVFSPTPERREAFARKVTEDLGVPASAVDSAQAATSGATVILAAARSRDEQPILFGDWLTPGTVVISIGSTVPSQREIDVSVVERCDLIVGDVIEEVMEETGDMIAAAKSGIGFHDKVFSLNAAVKGEIDARRKAAQYPMFKSVGGGIQDVVVAGLLMDKAVAAGLATALPISFQTKV